MAHQAHNIPWTLLASNLRRIPGSCGHCDGYDLHPRFKPNQGKELTHFAKAFANNVEEHSRCERRKYPDKYDAPSSSEVIVDGDTAAKIRPTVRRWLRTCKEERPRLDYGCGGAICQSDKDSHCQCPLLPREERIASAFSRQYQYTECYRFYQIQSAGYFNMELVKTLIVYGEMEPLLRVCAHPDVAIDSWWHVDECGCGRRDLGWDQIHKKALMAYICLDTIYCFPELWDLASGRTEHNDYRNTRSYQLMVTESTQPGDTSHVVAYPHRHFFGIKDPGPKSFHAPSRAWKLQWGQYTNEYGYFRVEKTYGKVSFGDFLAMQDLAGYEPALSDTEQVRSILCSKGLPVELALDIMDFADYKPKRRLNIAHDPLHPSNEEELAKYLKYCWQLLVRCDMMAKVLGMKIDWEEMVTECVRELWEARELSHKRFTKWCDDRERYVFA